MNCCLIFMRIIDIGLLMLSISMMLILKTIPLVLWAVS